MARDHLRDEARRGRNYLRERLFVQGSENVYAFRGLVSPAIEVQRQRHVLARPSTPPAPGLHASAWPGFATGVNQPSPELGLNSCDLSRAMGVSAWCSAVLGAKPQATNFEIRGSGLWGI